MWLELKYISMHGATLSQCNISPLQNRHCFSLHHNCDLYFSVGRVARTIISQLTHKSSLWLWWKQNPITAASNTNSFQDTTDFPERMQNITWFTEIIFNNQWQQTNYTSRYHRNDTMIAVCASIISTNKYCILPFTFLSHHLLLIVEAMEV